MKQKLLTIKSLLVAALLGVGVTSAWADETRTLVYSNDFETSSDWTANGKSDGWRVNPGTTDANTFGSKVIGNGSGTGDMGLYSPSFEIANDVKIVDVELKFKMDGCTSGKSSGIEFVQPTGVTIGGGYISEGTPFFKISASASGNGYWGTITVGGTDYTTTLNQASGTYENNSLNRNTTGIVVLNARFNFTTKEATFTLKKTDETVLVASTTVAFADNTATSLDKIFLHAGKSYGGVTIDDVSVYSVTTSETYANYTVHFVDNNGDPVKDDIVRNGVVGQTVNANSADQNVYINGNNKYVYDNDGGGVEVLNDGSAELTITYNKYAKFNYTINAVDGTDNVLAELASGYVYENENSVTTSLPWYVLYNGTLYYQNQNSNTTSITSNDQVVKITYAATETTNVAYYSEGENISGGTEISSANGSNKAAARALSSAKFTTLGAGKYKVVARFIVGNGTEGDTYATNPITIGENALVYNVPAKKNTTYASEEFVIAESTDFYVTFGGSSISGVDYIYVQRTGEATISKTITAAGWATYCSPYALDLANATGLDDAYIVTGGEGGVLTKTSVKGGTVPANTGLLLKGTEGSAVEVTIPVVASSSTDVSANILTGVTSNTVIAAEAGWVLMGSPSLGFYQNSGEFTVGANTAYIPVAKLAVPAGARPFFSLDGDATGISAALMNKETMNNEVYNLKGQRVSQPTKGLYIVNGKKVVIK